MESKNSEFTETENGNYQDLRGWGNWGDIDQSIQSSSQKMNKLCKSMYKGFQVKFEITNRTAILKIHTEVLIL